jgi:tRNA uridine 5-carbamoylmethylation protein Kti12
MNEKNILKKSEEVVSREIEGETILLPLYKSSKDMNYIYTLNKTAAAAWRLIDGKKTLHQIKEELVKEYDVDEEKAVKQLSQLVKDLRSIKAVK